MLVVTLGGSNELAKLWLDGRYSRSKRFANGRIESCIGNTDISIRDGFVVGGWERGDEVLREGGCYFDRPARVPLKKDVRA